MLKHAFNDTGKFMRKGFLSCAFYVLGIYTIVFAILPVMIDGAKAMGSSERNNHALLRMKKAYYVIK